MTTLRWIIKLSRKISILLSVIIITICYQNIVLAGDMSTASQPDEPREFWDWPAPPSFTNNSGVTAVIDHQNGNWRYYVSPYINLQPQNNQYLGVSEAYLEWDNGKIGFDIGRKIVTHGPGRYGYPVLGTLGSGLSAEGYDQIGYHFTWGNLKVHKFYALVSESSYRMLLGNRATYDLGPLTLGATEDILVNDKTPTFFYIPVPFTSITNTLNSSENKVVDFDLSWKPTEDIKFYVQYFIDDIPFGAGEYDKWPWRCGYQGGFAWQNAFHDSALSLYGEYTRINQYAYTHDRREFAWTYHSFFMGDLGPDADRLNVELVWQKSPEWQWSFAYQRVRHGEGKIGDRFIRVPGQTEVFLTGVVETTDLLAIGVSRKKQGYDFNCTLGLAYVQNANHVQGNNQIEPKASVNAKIYLPW